MRKKYAVYGYPRNLKRGAYRESQFIGYVYEYFRTQAITSAKSTFPDWIITNIYEYEKIGGKVHK